MLTPVKRRGHRLPFATVLLAGVAVVAIVVAAISLQHPRIRDAGPRPAQAAAVTSMAFLAGCGSNAVIAPLAIPIWCSASDQVLDNLTWSTWGASESQATGDLRDRACACAGGTYDRYPVRVVLSAPVRIAGTWRYSHLTLHFPTERPLWAFRPAFGFVWTPDGFVSEQDTK